MKKQSLDSNIFPKTLDSAISRVHSAMSAYYIWKWINNSINTNNEGKEAAQRMVNIMSTYASVFQQIKISTYKSFVADLWILFDKDGYEDSFSLEKLIKASTEKISEVEIIKIRRKIEQIKKENGATIAFLRELRNADVAHQEIDSKGRKLLYINIEKLFSAVHAILNLLSNSYNRSANWWDHIEPEIDHKMRWIMDNLERGERARIEEIDREYANATKDSPTSL